jgi:two-component system, LytTR family, sensor kinase
MVKIKKVWDNLVSRWQIIFSVIFLLMMLTALQLMFRMPAQGLARDGRVVLSAEQYAEQPWVALDGYWQLYWGRLLLPQDFSNGDGPPPDFLVKVPGGWNDRGSGTGIAADHGVATYRLLVTYPAELSDPSLSLKRVTRAFKVYANGELLAEVGKVSERMDNYQPGYELLTVDLPPGGQELELIIQVANLDYARGGLRESPIFGSRKALDRNSLVMLTLQVFFAGSVFLFFIYYLLLFLMQRKNKSSLYFSLLCLVTALRALIWGETPLLIIFPQAPLAIGIYINYITGYVFLPLVILFVNSIYPALYRKRAIIMALAPNLFFIALLAGPLAVLPSFNNYFYLVMLLQMIFTMSLLFKAVLRRKDYALLMLVAIGTMFTANLTDALNYTGLGIINITYMTMFGTFVVICALSFIQAVQQRDLYQQLVVYNKKMLEAEELKEKIRSTEIAFLQAQIKPHFLYNALNAISNIAEKDGKQGSSLILDLAAYFRNNLDLKNLDKMVTLEQELEFVRRYFNIEQARFGEKIKLELKVNASPAIKMPILVLQPLVENALRHGITRRPGGGRVILSAEMVEEGLIFTIEDNGVGMDASLAADILEGKVKGQSVGLLNINQRLLHFYGRGLSIESEPGCGTRVSFVIPKGAEEE